jgi:hypothetical protein
MAGVSGRPYVCPMEHEQLATYCRAGWTDQEIANKVGIPRHQVMKARAHYGIGASYNPKGEEVSRRSKAAHYARLKGDGCCTCCGARPVAETWAMAQAPKTPLCAECFERWLWLWVRATTAGAISNAAAIALMVGFVAMGRAAAQARAI